MLTNMLLSTPSTLSSDTFWDRSLQANDFHSRAFSNMLEHGDLEVHGDSGRPVVGRLQMPLAHQKPKHKLCEVCGNVGATSHYGGTVCGGCKIFFSRTVQSRKGFVCERDGQCPMSAGKRAKCRACRFQLCLRAHMSPDEVGRLRDMRMGEYSSIIKKEGSVVGYFDESSQPSTSLADCTSQIVSFIDVFPYGNHNETAILNIFVNLESSCENNGAMKYAKMFPMTCNASIDMPSAIGFPTPICEKIPMDYMRQQFLKEPKETLKLFWCRNVLHFLEWTTANDDLNQFPVHERTQLIAENFMAVASLTSFFGFLRIQREQFDAAEDSEDVTSSSSPPCSSEWFSEIMQLSIDVSFSVQKAVSEIMEPMDSLDVSIEEIVLLKFIMLFSDSTSRTFSDTSRIRCYRLKYCELLRKYVKSQIPDPEKRIERISELLKIVDAVRNTAVHLDNWMTMFYTSNVCEMNDVLVYDFHVRARSGDVTTSSAPGLHLHIKQEI